MLLRMRNVSDRFVEKVKTHILSSVTFFRKSYHLGHNVEKYGTARQTTDDNIIRRMRFACWITKATDTHSQYVILIGFPRKIWLRESATVLHYSTLPVLLFTSISVFQMHVTRHVS
jgi:hypothetical protein